MERDHSEDLVVDEKTIFKEIFKKYVRMWTGLIWSRLGKGCDLFWTR